MQVAIITDSIVYDCETTENSTTYLWQGKLPVKVSGGKLWSLSIVDHTPIRVIADRVIDVLSVKRATPRKTIIQVEHITAGVKPSNGSYIFGSVAVKQVVVRED